MPGFDNYVGFNTSGPAPITVPLSNNDPNIVRWIVASCRTHFETRRGIYKIFYQNTGPKDLIDSNNQKIDLYAEFRVDGPYIDKLTMKETKYTVDLNMLVHSGIDRRSNDKNEQMLGYLAAQFTDVIEVFKFGNGPDDDRTVKIGCLLLSTTKGQEVRVSRFGQANPDTLLSQASIDAVYYMRTVGL